jgi:hypothetical protein
MRQVVWLYHDIWYTDYKWYNYSHYLKQGVETWVRSQGFIFM